MVLAIIVAFFSVIILMVVHEFGHFIVAKKCGVKVEEFGVGYPPRIFGKKIGQTIYSLNLLPFGAFVKIYGEEGGIEDYQSFVGLPMWKKVFIVLGGVISFWVAAVFIFIIVFNLGVAMPISDEENSSLINAAVQVVDVSRNSPADAVGIRKGDIITDIKNQTVDVKIDKVADFQKFVNENKGQEITFTIKRSNEILNISLVPRVSSPQNQGPIGVQLMRTTTIIEKYPWYQTPIKGVAYCGELTFKATGSLIKILSNLITGKGLPAEVAPAGPIGITVYLARAAELGLGFFLYFIGAIAVLLAIFNLLPIPALDGGKLLFLAIEKIRSKAVSPKVEQAVTAVFFFLLISLSIFVTIKFDIPKLSEFLRQ